MKKILLLALSILIFGCSKEKEIKPEETNLTKQQISGIVEKGPFIQGSKVTLIDLDANLNPTGKIYETTTTSDQGTFEFKDITLSSSYAKFSVDGYFFNELTGTLSESRIILNAFSKIGDKKQVNLNLITHLESGRIMKLVKQEKMDFSAARKQAEKEILLSLGIERELSKPADELSITDGNQDASTLLAISLILLHNPAQSDVNLSRLLSIMSNQLEAEGKFNEETKKTFKAYAQNINFDQIKSLLIEKYKLMGKEITVSDDLKTLLASFQLPPIPDKPAFETEEKLIDAWNTATDEYTKFLETYYIIEALYAPGKDYSSIKDSYLSSFYNHTLDSSNPNINRLFANAYRAIYNINSILRFTKKENGNAISRIRKEAPVLLSHIYFILTDTWGDVVMHDPDNTEIILRPIFSPAETVRQYCIQELKKAIDGVDINTQGNTRFGKITAMGNGMLAKYYLQAGNYTEARRYLEALYHSSSFKLAEKQNIFINSSNNETYAGYDGSFGKAFNSPDFNLIAKKGSYPSFMRATETVLNLAELEIQTGNLNNAISYLNIVRVRNQKSKITNGNKEQLTNHLVEEYKENLSMEGVYFSALKRLGKAESVLKIESFRKLFPIPGSEFMYNPDLKQNPGY
ncbi:RagB/SusD family nutrient uptake outer membrane protein [Pedobacter caeni]|uniref:Starch-binding associating with outer membrane n=1 Tax=Pedobacter caeni TaxID=288992 RepID=A0A1M5PP19_9SPHI|nr:RagB/SusD family nutrient uptake outer membrane protein [Pedobacter caeni]SHH03565.1 Starch-binding associating with outer membrane [Pedobacter caeni]